MSSRGLVAAVVAASVCALLLLQAGCATGGRHYEEDPVLQRDVRQRIALIEHLTGVDAHQNLVHLGSVGIVSVPLLIEEMAAHESPRVRAGCAQALGYSQDSLAVEPLARAAVEDGDPGVRYTAAYNLLLFQEPRGLPVLAEALSSEEPSHRRDAFASLRAHTGQEFGYRPVAEPEAREVSARRWREWIGSLRPEEARLLLIAHGR